MTTITPNMDLVLPDIVTSNILGTLPQDWALIINADFVTIDAHDHAISGALIPSKSILCNTLVNINNNSILNLNYVSFVAQSSAQLLSLFTDGTDLYWQDSLGQEIQITKAGALNVTVDVGGFFGDYATSGAVAFLDNYSEYFGFYSHNAANRDTAGIVADSITFNTAKIAPSAMVNALQMFSNAVFNPPATLSLTAYSPKYVKNTVVATNSSGAIDFCNVSGDGSNYSLTSPNVPITDPNGIYDDNSAGSPYFTPALTVHQMLPQSLGITTFIEMFGNNKYYPLIGSDLIFMPFETKSFTILHSFPLMAKIPHWHGTFAVNQARWATVFPKSFVAGVGVNPLYKNLLVNIISVTLLTARDFAVSGTITTTSDVGLILPDNAEISSHLRIAALFPRYNAQGEFFGSQY